MDKRLRAAVLLSVSLLSFAGGGDDDDDSPPTGSNAFEVGVAIQGQGVLEIEFTTPAADGSFVGQDLFVETVSWSIGQTSVLRVAGTAVQEGGTVDLDCLGPMVRGTVRQSPWGKVTMYVEGTIYEVDPGQPFALTG